MALENGHAPDERTPFLNHEVDAGTKSEDSRSTRRVFLIMASAWTGSFLAALDSTLTTTLSATIATSFASLRLISMLGSAYIVGNIAVQPVCGKLTDIFSRRKGLLVSYLLFGLGNLVCGLAQREWVMVAGRVCTGLGGGGLSAISNFLASDLIPLRRRGVWHGFSNIMYCTGLALGGVFGGFVGEGFGWRWAFLSLVPLTVMGVTGVTLVVDGNVGMQSKGDEGLVQRLKRVDFLGGSLLIGALVAVMLLLISSGTSGLFRGLLGLLAIVLCGLFVWVEKCIALEPVIPLTLLGIPSVLVVSLANCLVFMAFFVNFYYIPLYLQIQGWKSSQVGLLILPESLGVVTGSLGAGSVIRATGTYTAPKYVGMSTFILATAGFSSLSLMTPTWATEIFLFLNGFSVGCMGSVFLLAVLSSVSQGSQAVVTSIILTFRSIGGTVGLAGSSALFRIMLSKAHLSERTGSNTDRDIEVMNHVLKACREHLDGCSYALLEVFMNAVRAPFMGSLVCAVLVLLLGIFIPNKKLEYQKG